MPQFELTDTGGGAVGRVRARDPEEAVRAWLGLEEGIEVSLEDPPAAMDALEGWRIIRVKGEELGRIRPHQRMRFRRD